MDEKPLDEDVRVAGAGLGSLRIFCLVLLLLALSHSVRAGNYPCNICTTTQAGNTCLPSCPLRDPSICGGTLAACVAGSATSLIGYCATNAFQIASIAPWYCNYINQAVYQQFSGLAPLAILAVLLSFSVATLIFLTGIIIGNRRVRDFGVGELYEALASTIFVAFFMLIALAMLGILPGFITGPIDPFITAMNYTYHTISATEDVIRSLFMVNTRFAYYSSIDVKLSFFGTATSIFQVLAGVFTLIYTAPATGISDLLVAGLLLLHVEFYMMLFGLYSAIPVFLIPGVIMRSFLPTRSVGGMFIGIAVGFYFTMPVLFSVAYYFTNQGALSNLVIANQQINQYGYNNADQNAVSPSSPLALTLKQVETSMGTFWLSVVFYPALIVGMTYFTATTVSEFLGGFTTSTGRLLSL